MNMETLKGEQGTYVLGNAIGRGGSSIVYLGQSREGSVAVKIGHSGSDLEPEARCLQLLADCENVPTLRDRGIVDGRDFLVMDYISGEGLEKKLLFDGPLPLGEGLKLTFNICDALSAAHQKNIIHGDIKPANIILSGKGYLIDFGTAGDLNRRQGTLFYHAPEAMLTPQSDLFSLGVTLYEIFTGSKPIETGRLPLHHIVTMPHPLSKTIMKAMAEDPEERHSSIADFKQELQCAMVAPPQLAAALN